MAREIPKELYVEVSELATAIAQPFSEPLDFVDDSLASQAYAKLRMLFDRRERAGEADPFLTETLADFTDDALEAVRLYELSIRQSQSFPGETTYTKRVGLARRLQEMGRTNEALQLISTARRDAFAAKDTDVLKELEELAKVLRV